MAFQKVQKIPTVNMPDPPKLQNIPTANLTSNTVVKAIIYYICYVGKVMLILQRDKKFSLLFLFCSFLTLVISCFVTTQYMGVIIYVQIDPPYSQKFQNQMVHNMFSLYFIM